MLALNTVQAKFKGDIMLDVKHKSSYTKHMNRLSVEKRSQILSMLCEGMSMRSVSRIADVSINTVSKLLVEAGRYCSKFHDDNVVGVKAKRVQCDEVWSFCYAKQKNVDKAKDAPDNAGDVWTWTGIDADSKLIISWLVDSTKCYQILPAHFIFLFKDFWPQVRDSNPNRRNTR